MSRLGQRSLTTRLEALRNEYRQRAADELIYSAEDTCPTCHQTIQLVVSQQHKTLTVITSSQRKEKIA